MESDVDHAGWSGRLRLWVCPKAAYVVDDVFPVGTTLVVERFSHARISDGVPQSVFMMEKVSSVDRRGAGRPSREGWACAVYDAGGRNMGRHALADGICRWAIMS